MPPVRARASAASRAGRAPGPSAIAVAMAEMNAAHDSTQVGFGCVIALSIRAKDAPSRRPVAKTPSGLTRMSEPLALLRRSAAPIAEASRSPGVAPAAAADRATRIVEPQSK